MNERILDAALVCFERAGVRATTLDDVARAAGVGRVTVYRRVGGREQLIEAVALREAERLLAVVERAIEPFDGLEDRITEAFTMAMLAIFRHRMLARVLETEPGDVLPALTLEAEPLLAVGRDFLTDELTQGGVDPADAVVAADLVVRLTQSLVLTAGGPVPVDDPSALRDFARRYLVPVAVGATVT